MKKFFYVMICFLILQNKGYGNGFVHQALRYHNKPIEQGTNATDPVDHGRYVPYLFPEQEPQRTIFYYQGKNRPMYIAFTLIVSNGSYGDIVPLV